MIYKNLINKANPVTWEKIHGTDRKKEVRRIQVFFTLEYLTNGVSCNKIEICRKKSEK